MATLVHDWLPAEQAQADKLRDAQAEAVTHLASQGSGLAGIADNASGFAEEMSKRLLHPMSPKVACKDACSWCCYQQVRVSAPEVIRISEHVRSAMDEEAQKEVLTRLKQLDAVTRGLSVQGRTKIPKPCAFLVDNRCSIYEVRPMSCAEFTSYDVQVCKRGKRVGFKADGVIHEKARMLAYYAIQQGLIDGTAAAFPESDDSWLELTAAVVIALESSEAEADWIAGKPVFAPAKLRSLA
jgi:Fe-S-cluster containining protein